MGTPNSLLLHTLFNSLNKYPAYEFFSKKMVLFLSSFWLTLVTLFRFTSTYILRFLDVDDSSQKTTFYTHDDLPPPLEDDEILSNYINTRREPGVDHHENMENDVPKFSFKFQFQNYEDTRSSSGDFTPNSSKYEFLPKKHISGFMEEPEVVSFSVKELFLNFDNNSLESKEIVDNGFLSEKDFVKLKKGEVCEEIMDSSCSGEDSEKPESIILTDVTFSEEEQTINLGRSSPEKEELRDEIRFLVEDELASSDSEPESANLWDRFSVMVNTMNSDSDEFLSDGDFDSGAEEDASVELDNKKGESLVNIWNFDGMHIERERISDQGGAETSTSTSPVQNPKGCDKSTDLDEVLDMFDDVEKLEKLNLQGSTILETDANIEKEYSKIQAECEQEDSGKKENEVKDNFEISEESEDSGLQDSSLSDFEESNNLETLWEHQDLIEQLKMEIRKVKATGLPTILEESESPRMSEDLKPWKIDEKFVHQDQMDGLHKFYKSYNERMRKLDILNYQKMYAIGIVKSKALFGWHRGLFPLPMRQTLNFQKFYGFLKLKDPLKTMSNRNSSATFSSAFSQNFLSPKRRRPEVDSSTMFIRELESDLETVYVGHLCLSWEFLHWQYGKARELLESDPYEIRPYNQVAGEFQQFQVLMQRFVENEPFQGPRVQNYIKNRCVLRNLLQVPVIKEDPKDKEGRKRSKDAITCSMLLEIIEESMRVFWEFVRADKDEASVILKGLSGPEVKFIDPSDTELLLDIQTNLQKKEKKLKDILRSGNCLVKRFQKQQHKEQSDQLVFFSQIDLKLVSRVLRMSRITTDQLGWCHRKLNKMSFVQRKIHVEPSFLLFPC